MIPIDTLLLFFTTSVLLGLSPGPDNLFVMAQSIQRGPGSGLLVTLGLCTGLVVHSAAVAFGLAAVFQASALAFTLLKWVGAGYLLYLAWLAFRAGADTDGDPTAAALPRGHLYRRGIIMNITNPKVSVFFLAFLPQFADPARGPLAVQLLILGAVFIVATILVFGAVSLLAGAVGERFRRSSRAQIILNRLAGTVFAALALKLATTTR